MASKGFTLIEILVVLLIIGVLASLGVTQYYKAVEEAKADQASAMVAMIGSAARMYMVDHPSITGFVGGSGQLTTACNQECCYDGFGCNTGVNGNLANLCQIVACGYLSFQDFDCLPYTYEASSGGPIGGGSPGYAMATRKQNAGGCSDPNVMSNLGTTNAPYSQWGYEYMQQGCLCPLHGAPLSSNFANKISVCQQGCY